MLTYMEQRFFEVLHENYKRARAESKAAIFFEKAFNMWFLTFPERLANLEGDDLAKKKRRDQSVCHMKLFVFQKTD